MKCPLCSQRPAKRACPALGQEICPTCCATKRLVEIRCPSDCRYLDAAQRHPAAAVRRQQEHDLATLMASMERRLSEIQLQLFFLLASVVVRHKPEGFVALRGGDVAEAAGAAAGTLEAASRGLIAEMQAASTTGEGLRRQFKTLLDELGRGGGSRFERDAALVLRGIERSARHEGPGPDQGAWTGETPYLTLLTRVLPPPPEERAETDKPSLILP